MYLADYRLGKELEKSTREKQLRTQNDMEGLKSFVEQGNKNNTFEPRKVQKFIHAFSAWAEAVPIDSENIPLPEGASDLRWARHNIYMTLWKRYIFVLWWWLSDKEREYLTNIVDKDEKNLASKAFRSYLFALPRIDKLMPQKGDFSSLSNKGMAFEGDWNEHRVIGERIKQELLRRDPRTGKVVDGYVTHIGEFILIPHRDFEEEKPPTRRATSKSKKRK